ncbi:MAG TPA: glycoside hydrolase family 16 protein [Bacteroidia bacterium]|nr:glycoside hydrolase family 16 protein [Bacteroidia bacterium]
MMRYGWVVAFGLLAANLGAQGPQDPEAWELTFADEFDGDRLDYEKWTPKDPWGTVRNDELQAYIVKAFHVADGILKIRCEDEPAFYDGAKRDYRSGMMTTAGKFVQRYGRFEIRCKVPKGKGLWPAFWLLPETMGWPPEIDVLEILGHETDRIHLSHHWADPIHPEGKPQSQTADHKGVDFGEGFHTAAVEWEPGEIRWYVDGVERHRSKRSVPDGPMYLLVNLALGGGWAGPPDGTTVFPADFEIDYVRVWQRKGR